MGGGAAAVEFHSAFAAFRATSALNIAFSARDISLL